jgi:serine/threonine-protein kinase
MTLAGAKVELEPGDLLAGKYRVETIIGSGGMGVVLSARHVAMGHRLAIKVLRMEAEERDPRGAVDRFLREARAAARIQSEHVVRVTDVGTLRGGTPYLVMEYLDGEDLKGVLAARPQLPVGEAVGYVIQACEGLAEAHAAGVIHRDLKPSNLFLTKKANGTAVVKVLDFGISKVRPRQGEVAATTTNSLMGSPLYMSPEQMRSAKDVDERTDIWALGLILYELLAGVAPFEGETIPEVCVAVMGSPPMALSRFRNDVPPGLQAILLKCMEKDRDARYRTMGELARALEGFVAEQLRMHADRASAAIKSARGERPSVEVDTTLDDMRPAEEIPSEVQKRRASRPDDPTAARLEPDSVPSWSAASRKRGARSRVWLTAGLTVCALAALLGARLAYGPARGEALPAEPSKQLVSAPPRPSTPPPALSPTPTPAPVATIATIPVESLPAVSLDAGDLHAERPPRSVPSASQTPAPSGGRGLDRSQANGSKDAWKWGDRK